MSDISSILAPAESEPFARPRRGLKFEDCQFYHTMDIPGVGTVKGFGDGNWDLRGCLDPMLGGIDYAGKRVLEVGPASGQLTFEMERRGADVVAVDVPHDHEWDSIPLPANQDRWQRGSKAGWTPQTNAWWFAHEHFNSRARMVYVSGGALDRASLGAFDVAVMANVLLHTRDHLKTVENCARKTTGRIVIVEQWHPDLEHTGLPLCCLKGLASRPDNWNDWFRFSSAYFVRHLEILGFGNFWVTRFSAPWNGMPIEYFTLVASRLNA